MLKQLQFKYRRHRWVRALRSGKFPQGRNYLSREGGYCCLGVACELFKSELKLDVQTLGNIVTYDDNAHYLPDKVRDYLGLRTSQGLYHPSPSGLAWDNDEGKSHREIADIIESNPEGLFV